MLLALGMKGFDMLVEDFASSNSTSTTNSTLISTTSANVGATTLTESQTDELETTAGLTLESAHFEALVDPNSSNVTTFPPPSEVTFSTTTESETSTLLETVSSESRSTMITSSEGSTILDILTDKTNIVIETTTSLEAKMTTTETTTDHPESETASSILSTAPSSLKTSFFDESRLTAVISAVSITTLVLIILGIILFFMIRYRKRLGCCDEYHWYKCWYLLCPCEVRLYSENS